MTKFRFYRPEDRKAVEEIFRRQNLPVYLPIPYNEKTGEGDPAVVAAIVCEEDGEVKRYLVARGDVEAHYITNAEEPQGMELLRMMAMAEGAVMQLNMELSRLKFPVYTMTRARVLRSMTKMVEFMKRKLGFVEEKDEFQGLCKPIGN